MPASVSSALLLPWPRLLVPIISTTWSGDSRVIGASFSRWSTCSVRSPLLPRLMAPSFSKWARQKSLPSSSHACVIESPTNTTRPGSASRARRMHSFSRPMPHSSLRGVGTTEVGSVILAGSCCVTADSGSSASSEAASVARNVVERSRCIAARSPWRDAASSHASLLESWRVRHGFLWIASWPRAARRSARARR